LGAKQLGAIALGVRELTATELEARKSGAIELGARKWRARVLGVGESGSIELEARELGVVHWVHERLEQENWEQ
jgi:hypothetical protein